jgi:hypothetical protein
VRWKKHRSNRRGQDISLFSIKSRAAPGVRPTFCAMGISGSLPRREASGVYMVTPCTQTRMEPQEIVPIVIARYCTSYAAPEQCYIFIRTAGLMVSVWCIFCVTGAAGHGHLIHCFSSACTSGICLFSTLHFGNTYVSSSTAYLWLVPNVLENNALGQRRLQYNPQMTLNRYINASGEISVCLT